MAESNPISTPAFSFSVENYHKMADAGILKSTDRVELIEGKILTMSPMKSAHAACVDRLGDILRHNIPYKVNIRQEKAITLGTHSEPEPDIAIVKFREDYYETAHPKANDILLLIEVSLSIQKYDRETKLPLYASHDIPEVWIVDLKDKVIEVYQKPIKNTYETKAIFSTDEKLTSSVVQPLAVKRVIRVKRNL